MQANRSRQPPSFRLSPFDGRTGDQPGPASGLPNVMIPPSGRLNKESSSPNIMHTGERLHLKKPGPRGDMTPELEQTRLVENGETSRASHTARSK